MEKTGLDWWLWRDETAGAKQAAEQSWESWQAPHRQNIAMALQLIEPFDSLYEVGCQAGPNLRLAKHLYPNLTIGGSEPCPIPASMAADNLGCIIDTHSLPDMATEKHDVVLSCYTLAYVSPEDIEAALLGMTHAANRAIVLLEPTAWGQAKSGRCRFDHMIEWRHDYKQLLDDIGWRIEWAWPLIPPAMNANALIVATRGTHGAI